MILFEFLLDFSFNIISLNLFIKNVLKQGM